MNEDNQENLEQPKVKVVRHPNLFFILALGFFGLCLIWIFGYWQNTLFFIGDMSFSFQNIHYQIDPPALQAKPPQQTVKGLYLTAYSAGSSKKINEIINLINKTELNAVVIDIKDYSGKVLYNSQLSMVKSIGAVDNRLGDVTALIKKLHRSIPKVT